MKPSQFWKQWEKTLTSVDEIDSFIRSIHQKWPDKTFAWRGAVNADWAMHSALFRRVAWTRQAADPKAKYPNERILAEEEEKVIESARRWGLHSGARGRLSALELLATLQHFGAPTRLLDITFNPYMGVFFAVEEQVEHASSDGRLFAIDVTSRLINDHADYANWEHEPNAPWCGLAEKEWCAAALAWRPPAFDRRIAAQQGAFLLGGVPSTAAGQWPKEPTPQSKKWKIDETRAAISVSMRVHKVDGNTKAPMYPAYTVRIAANAKQTVRRALERLYGFSHATVYPDFPGFASYGMPTLRSKP